MKERNIGSQKIMKVKFTIPGPPVAKQRPRLGRGGRVYTPAKTKAYESKVASYYGSGYYFKDEFISVNILFKFEVPKSWSKKKKSEALKGNIRPTRADTDNYVKSILDGLNKVSWEDDRYIFRIEAEKVYSDRAETIVEIKSME